MLTEKDLDREKVDALFDSGPAPTRHDGVDKSMEFVEESKIEQLHRPQPALNLQSLDGEFTGVLEKIRNQELSLANLSQEERSVIKRYLNIQLRSVVDSKYPAKIEGLTDV
jgi:hypothetical protein